MRLRIVFELEEVFSFETMLFLRLSIAIGDFAMVQKIKRGIEGTISHRNKIQGKPCQLPHQLRKNMMAQLSEIEINLRNHNSL